MSEPREAMQGRETALAAAVGAPDYLVVYGSRLYGTDTPESDIDERGFVVPPFEYLTGLCRFDQSCSLPTAQARRTAQEAHPSQAAAAEPRDRIVWSLARFVLMLLAGDPQAYEMLFVPDDKVIACSQAGRRVRDARELFACTRFHRRIAGYAQAEWRKVRGVTLGPALRTRDEETIVDDIRAVFAPGKGEMDEILRLLFLRHERSEKKATRKLGDKRKLQIDRFGFCVSSASHSVRLMGELEELMRHGRLTFPRPNAGWLLAVRQGRVPFAEVEAEFGRASAAASAAAAETMLPEKPRLPDIEMLYHSIVASRLLSDGRIGEYASLAEIL